MTNASPSQLSDRDLLAATVRVSDACRRSTAELIGLLAELDKRKLYLGESYPSLFIYCTQALHLSEPTAYSRITAARVARGFPVILALLADGSITLTTITLLAAHLTDENHETLLEAARHKSKRDIERLVAAIDPQPDVASSVRKLPVTKSAGPPGPSRADVFEPPTARASALLLPDSSRASVPTARATAPVSRAIVAPLAPERYLVKITVSRETHEKLERARDLLRHSIPSGDPAAIVDRALTVLVEQLERTKVAAVRRPRTRATRTSTARRAPAAVRRAVWARDEGRCAFVGSAGRCSETGFLEFHHVVPFAAGGVTAVENLQLRCRSHNQHEADSYFKGEGRRTRQTAAT